MRASGVRLLQKGRRYRRTILRARNLAGTFAKLSGKPFQVELAPFQVELAQVLDDELARAQAQAGRSAAERSAA